MFRVSSGWLGGRVDRLMHGEHVKEFNIQMEDGRLDGWVHEQMQYGLQIEDRQIYKWLGGWMYRCG